MPSFSSSSSGTHGDRNEGHVSMSDPYVGVAFKIGMATLLHPVDYAKTLIQIGHEPVPPTQTTTFLRRKPALALPSVFKYIGIIRKREGWTGLYTTGLTPRLLGIGAAFKAEEVFSQYWPAPEEVDFADKSLSEEELRRRIVASLKWQSCQKISVVLATQPFNVLAVRAIAQFVGGEHKYDGILASIRQVLEENGILGFWSGWLPRAIGEVCLVCLATTFTYVVNRYILEDQKDMRKYTSHFSGYIASSLVYPFTVVSNCMVVSRSGLAAGYPPYMPLYMSWLDCYKHLKRLNMQNRGSALLFRYYTGPQVIVGGRALPVNR